MKPEAKASISNSDIRTTRGFFYFRCTGDIVSPAKLTKTLKKHNSTVNKVIFGHKKSPLAHTRGEKGSSVTLVVEPRGIEPLSENPSTQLSPSAVCLLKFPCGSADKQAQPLGSLWYITDCKATHQ